MKNALNLKETLVSNATGLGLVPEGEFVGVADGAVHVISSIDEWPEAPDFTTGVRIVEYSGCYVPLSDLPSLRRDFVDYERRCQQYHGERAYDERLFVEALCDYKPILFDDFVSSKPRKGLYFVVAPWYLDGLRDIQPKAKENGKKTAKKAKKENNMENKPLYEIDGATASLHISKGNRKIGKGIYAFSTLPGNGDHLITTSTQGLLTDVPGTCSKFCDGCFGGGCYAVRDAKLHHNVTIRSWGENTILLRRGDVWPQLRAFFAIKNGKAMKILSAFNKSGDGSYGEALAKAREAASVRTFRINVSGEIESLRELREWVSLAKDHPETQFGVYTKNFDALGEYLDAGEDFPDNFVVNISQWHGVADAFLAKYAWANLNVFEYDDSNVKGNSLSEEDVERLAKAPHCPSVTRDGHHAKNKDGSEVTCDQCRRCYRKTGRLTAVYAH